MSSTDLKCILAVEDEPYLLSDLAEMLGAEGYEVWTAPNGQQALALLDERLPDLILSDILMPEVDGFEFLQRTRAHAAWQHIPFIVITAHATRTSRERAYELGASGYITKPFRFAELLALIADHLPRAD